MQTGNDLTKARWGKNSPYAQGLLSGQLKRERSVGLDEAKPLETDPVMNSPQFWAQADSRMRLTVGGAVTSIIGAAALLVGAHGFGAVLLLTGNIIVALASPTVAVWAILLLLPFHPIAMRLIQIGGLGGWPFLAVSAWKEVALLAALLALGGRALRRARLRGRLTTGSIWIGDCLAGSLIVLVGIAVLLNPSLRTLNGARLLLFPVGLYMAIRLQPISPKTMFTRLVIAGLALASFGIIQGTWLGWDFVQGIYAWPSLPIPAIFSAQHLDGPRAAGTLLSPNEFALVVAASICLATALAIRASGRTRRVLMPVLVVLVIGLAVSFSRSAVLGCALAVAAMAVAARGRSVEPRSAATVLLFAFIPALAISGAIYAERGGLALIGSSLANVGDVGGAVPTASTFPTGSPRPGSSPAPSPTIAFDADPSTIGHIESLGQGWQNIVDHPFGVGLGNVGARPLPGTAERPEFVVESWYFAMALSLGWPGLIWALGFPVVLGVAAVRGLRRGRSELAAIAAVGLAVLIAFIGIVLPTMMEPEVSVLPWAVLALLGCDRLGADRVPSRDAPHQR